ncbi:MAG: PilZ domain-containing protein [Vicinamibacterales bacterium]
MEEATKQHPGPADLPLTVAMPTAVFAATERARSEAQQKKENRRSHQRVPGAALDWVQVARVKYGPEVSIVDLSPGGVLVESLKPLKPGSKQALEIAGPDKTIIVPFGVLRSKITSIGPNGAVYRAACAFNRLLDLPGLTSDPGFDAPSQAQVDVAVSRMFTPETLMETVIRASATTSKPEVTHGWQKAVVRFVDGAVRQGYSDDFDVNRPTFSLAAAPSREAGTVPIAVADLKAVCFVSVAGRAPGTAIQVTFNDCETISGTTPEYRADSIGFYLRPADPRASHARIFVVSSAVRQVRLS